MRSWDQIIGCQQMSLTGTIAVSWKYTATNQQQSSCKHVSFAFHPVFEQSLVRG